MWNLVIFLCLTITWAEAQNGRGPQYQDHNGHGWDIRLAVPGEPGNDYPTLGAIPRTTFSCAGKEPGYYADIETNCQVFRVCTVGSTYGFQSFLCPNGTLFNQAVFVCDWWMNVNCKNSQQLINNNSEKFENLRLGPQLMKDIKKMLTHPMRNPYDKNIMKSNLIVMQDYKPPTGQLFPNGALLAGPERPPNNVYVPSKQIQQNFIQSNPTDHTFLASTPDPRYISAQISNNYASIQKDETFIQKQPQNGQNTRTGRVQASQNSHQNSHPISNSHSGRFIQNSNSNFNNNNIVRQLSQVTRPSQFSTFTQMKTNTGQPLTNSIQNNQRGLANRQRPQFSEPKQTSLANNENHSDVGNVLTDPHNNQNSLLGLPRFSNEINNGKATRDLKDNLVSTSTGKPTTHVTKTYSRVIPKTRSASVNPKSPVTIKTWIIKPTKSGRQLTDPAPYTYTTPSLPFPTPSDIIIDETTPYIYEMPKSLSLSINNGKSTELNIQEPYVYPKPTIAAKQIQQNQLQQQQQSTATESETTRLYVAPTLNPTYPTFSEHINLPSTPPLPTKSSRYYLPPTSFQASNRLYLPPSRDYTTLSRQYLPPNDIPQEVYYQSEKLTVNPSVSLPTNTHSHEHLNQPSFVFNKNLRVNNNSTFTDILTKEKLNISVNDIVKDTHNILKTASPLQYNQYRKNFIKSLDPYQNYDISTKITTGKAENLSSQIPLQSNGMRLVATPAITLVPPDESIIYPNVNPISNLPFYKESGLPNTIERTVSIKITIPEKIAMYLFKNQNAADFDKLEILNTGSSNYLVLSNTKNNLLTKKSGLNFIPIAKLSENNNTRTISDSQALVYSFFTDSINVARENRNIAQQEVISSTVTPSPGQFQNLNNQQLSDITNKISHLTSSQFASNNFNSVDRNARIITTQPTFINQFIPFTGNLKYTNEHQARQLQIQSNNDYPTHKSQKELYSSRFQMQNHEQDLLNDQNKIYSGQLYRWPVPEVTNQIYNRQTSENLINANTLQDETTHMFNLQRNTNQNNAADNFKQTTPEVEIIKAETVNLSPAKLQFEASNESNQVTSTETLTNLFNSGNGISAHLQDKIVGTIPHPVEKNKLVTYRKDRSYYLYSKPDDNGIDEPQTNTITQNDAQSIQNSNTPNLDSFQLIPSVNYELNDVEEQKQILDAFQIDEFGAPRDIIKEKTTSENSNRDEVTTSSIGPLPEQNTSNRGFDGYRTDPRYSGLSSYIAPQSSIGNLENGQDRQNNFNSKLENFDNNNRNGYLKDSPARQFVF